MGLIPNNPWVAHGVDPEFFYGPLPPGPRVSGQWMALSPWYLLAFVLLLIGGLGTAAFSNMQTTLILTEAPPPTRSRVMGIVTMCIGTGPVGVVLIGILSGQVGPPVAILITAGLGICRLSLVWRGLIRPNPTEDPRWTTAPRDTTLRNPAPPPFKATTQNPKPMARPQKVKCAAPVA